MPCNFESIDGELVLIGAPLWDGSESGIGRLFVIDPTTGDHVAAIQHPDPQSLAVFGISAVLDGSIVTVGAWKQNGALANSGEAYIIDWTTGELLATLVPSDGVVDGAFGYRLDRQGSEVFIGAFGFSLLIEPHGFYQISGFLLSLLPFF